MKKLIVILALAFVSFVSTAQERTVSITLSNSSYAYHSSVLDTLKETTKDTIDYIFTNQNPGAVEKLSFTMSLDSLAGNDSIYYVLSGANNSNGTYTTLSSGGILVDASNKIVDITKWYWTNATTFVDLNYRFYRLRFIQDENNSYDGGAKFDYLIGKLYFK